MADDMAGAAGERYGGANGLAIALRWQGRGRRLAAALTLALSLALGATVAHDVPVRAEPGETWVSWGVLRAWRTNQQSLVLHDGKPRMALSNEDRTALGFAWCDAQDCDRPSAWATTTVIDGIALGRPVLAISETGRPWIAFHDGTWLKIATCDTSCEAPTSWTITALDDTGPAGASPMGLDLALDAAGRPSVAFSVDATEKGALKPDFQLIHRSCDGGCDDEQNWDRTVLSQGEQDLFHEVALRLADDRPRILTNVTVWILRQAMQTELRWLHCTAPEPVDCHNTEAWTSTVVPQPHSVVTLLALALDDGRPRIVYVGEDHEGYRIVYSSCERVDCSLPLHWHGPAQVARPTNPFSTLQLVLAGATPVVAYLEHTLTPDYGQPRMVMCSAADCAASEWGAVQDLSPTGDQRFGPPSLMADGAGLHLAIHRLVDGPYVVYARCPEASCAGTIDAGPPPDLPGEPQNVAVTAGDARATVSWEPPVEDGGAAITGYELAIAPQPVGWSPPELDGEARGHTVQGLSNGTTYAIALAAVNPAGAGRPVERQAHPRSVPSAPAGFTAGPGDRQVALAWSPPHDDGGADVTGYQLAVSPAPTGWTPPTLDADARAHSVSGLDNGTSYRFALAAVNELGTGVDAAQDAVPRTVPGAVATMSAQAGDGQVELSWSPPDDDGGAAITGYSLSVSPAPDGWQQPTLDAAISRHTVTGLANGSAYEFTLAAVNAAGAGPGTSRTATPRGVPSSPRQLQASPGDRQVTLSWAPPASDGGSALTGYALTVQPQPPGWEPPHLGPGTVRHTVTGVSNGTSYAFDLAAVNELGTSSPAMAAATPRTVPSVPRNLTATPGDGQVTLTWQAPVSDGGAERAAYTLTVSPMPSNGQETLTLSPSLTTATVTGLANGTPYTFDLAAQNAAGSGPGATATTTPRRPSTGGGGGGGGGGGTGGGGAALPPAEPTPAPSTSPSPTPPPPDPAPGPLSPGTETVRMSGDDRIDTAAAVVAAMFPDPVRTVYLTTAWGYADALAGGAAAAHEDAPILLVGRDQVPEPTARQLDRLRPDVVVLLGGPSAVGHTVAAQVAASGVRVERRAGADRYGTAAAVSEATFPRRVPVVYVSTGEGFADALSGGAAAARGGGPVLLVEPDQVPEVAAAELRRLAPTRIVVLGGPAAVSPGVEQALRGFTSGEVMRVHGPDRYATSARVVAEAFPGTARRVYVATGTAFADALAAVPAAGRSRAPLLLVASDHLPQPVADELARLAPEHILLLGGSRAISAEVAEALRAAADPG